MTEKKSNLGYKITIILLSLIIVWLVYDKITTGKENTALLAEIETNTLQKDSLHQELSELYFAYDGLETNNQQLNDSLTKQQEHIVELMDELKNVKANDYAKIKQLKQEVETLKKIMKSYVRQIDSLYQENQILIAENTEIKVNLNQANQINEQLNQSKDSLQQTVNVAKELVAYNTNFVALNERGKTTDRIKKAKKFQICFMVSENKVTSTGRKNVYIRITKPISGEVLRNDNSGFFNFQGQSIAYSSYREIEYDGSAQDVCLFYNLNTEDMPKGDYSVFIFVDGKQIGDKSITLK